MAKCAACKRVLRTTGGAECKTCPRVYHKACVGIAEANPVTEGWICPECNSVKPRGDNTNTPIKSAGTSPVPSDGLDNIQPQFLTPTINVPTNDGIVNEIREMRADFTRLLHEIREEFRGFQASVNERLDGLEQRLCVVEQRDIGAPEKISELQTTVDQLKSQLNDRDQEALLADLDIGHVPETAGENTGHTVTVLAAKLGVTIQERDIVFAERVGRPDQNRITETESTGRPRRVIVRLARRSLRDEILRAARVRRSLTFAETGLAGPPSRVFVNERLTKLNRQLFHLVRGECRKREWRYCWTKQGRIYARKGDGTQVYQIHSSGDFDRVFGAKSI